MDLLLDDSTFHIMEMIADSMPGGFFIYHADGDESLIYYNRSMLRIFGCDTREEFEALVGNSFKGIVHPEDLEEVEQSIKKQIRSSEYDMDYVEYRIRKKDGTIRWIEDYGHFAHSAMYGDVFCVFIEDATDRMEKRRAQAVSIAKSKFISEMSNDIRTPVNAVIGYTDQLADYSDDPKVLDCVEKIRQSGNQLLAVVERALEVTSEESEKAVLAEDHGNMQDIRPGEGSQKKGPVNVLGRLALIGKRILLVEDNELHAEITQELLKQEGFVIELAENGKIAVDKIQESAPGYYSVVLMDIQMPVMDGYEATRQIRQMDNKLLAHIPIVALSANAFPEDQKKSMECGMDAHCPKPIEIEGLIDLLRRVLAE